MGLSPETRFRSDFQDGRRESLRPFFIITGNQRARVPFDGPLPRCLDSSVFTLALAQLRVEGGEVAANLSRAKDAIDAAARQGAGIVLLPEALDCGWTDPSARIQAGGIPEGPACQALRAAAAEHRIWVCAGLVERSGECLFNAAVLIRPDGAVVLHHRKLNELDLAHDLYAPGDRLGVAETPFGTIGVMICSDGFVPGLPVARTLGLMGARVILSPCAWAVPSDHDPVREPYGALWRESYAPVAREFGLWIAGVSNVGPVRSGPWAGRRCIGCSLLVGPDGSPVAQGPYGESAEALLLARIQVSPARRACLGP